MSSADEEKNLGNQEFKNKNFEQALIHYSKAIQMNPNECTYYSNRSGCYASLDRFEEALQDANKCIEINPNFVKGYSRKGLALERLGREEEAKEAYDAGLKIDPENAQLKRDRASLDEAEQQSMGDLMGMLNNPEIRKMMQQNPQLMQSLLQNPNIFKDPNLLAQMMNFFGKKEGGPKADASAQDAPKAHDHAGHAHPHPEPEPKQQHYEAPKPHSKPAPKAEAPKKLSAWDEEKAKGDGEYRKRNFDAAVAHYDECIKIEPHSLLAYNNKAACLIELKRLADAEAAVDEAIKVYKEGEASHRNYQHFAKVLARKGRICHLKNDLKAAQKFYEDSLMEDRSEAVEESLRELKREIRKAEELAYQDPVLSEKHREAGNEFFQKGEFGKAITEYEEAKKRNPNDPKVYNNIAACFIKIMKYNEALKEVERALELDPKFTKAMIRKGTIHNLLREHHKALEVFNKVLVADPSNAEAKEGLEQTQNKIAMGMYEGNDEERMKRAMADPEIVAIMSDPMVRIALEQMSQNSQNAMEYMKDSSLGPKINKLIAAGVIKTK